MSLPEDLQAECDKAQKAAEVFCFDVEKFKRDMKSDDTMTIIVRAHLHLEHVIIQLIVESLVHPDAIALGKLSFPSKCDLAIALGLIPRNWRTAIIGINEVRNRVAHRLDFSFSLDDEKKIKRSMPSGYIAAVQFELGKKEEDINVTDILLHFPIFVDYLRQKTMKDRIFAHFVNVLLHRTVKRDKR